MNVFGMSAIAVCASLIWGGSADAQSWQMNRFSVALKSGESIEVSDLYWVTNCHSLLTAPPEVTIMEGPQGVTASVQDAMVVPRFQQCSKPVKGAKLILTAGQIEDASNTLITLRVRYPTKDGVRNLSDSGTIQLFP